MPEVRRCARGQVLVLVVGLCCAVLGCGDSGGVGKLVPVVGKITVDGKPLTTGSVSFRPDRTKGNTSEHEPAGDINGQGYYKLYTATREGAPPGHYKVLVVSAEPGVYPPKTLYVNSKYADLATSGLTIEVVEQPAEGAYDLNLTK